MPKKARENASLLHFLLLRPSLPPSFHHPFILSWKRREERGCGRVWRVDQWALARDQSDGALFLNNSPAWLYCTGLCWDTEPASV